MKEGDKTNYRVGKHLKRICWSLLYMFVTSRRAICKSKLLLVHYLFNVVDHLWTKSSLL